MASYRLLLVALSICSSRAVLAPDDHHPIIVRGGTVKGEGCCWRAEGDGCRPRESWRWSTWGWRWKRGLRGAPGFDGGVLGGVASAAAGSIHKATSTILGHGRQGGGECVVGLRGGWVWWWWRVPVLDQGWIKVGGLMQLPAVGYVGAGGRLEAAGPGGAGVPRVSERHPCLQGSGLQVIGPGAGTGGLELQCV